MRGMTQEKAYRLARAFDGADTVFQRVARAAARRSGRCWYPNLPANERVVITEQRDERYKDYFPYITLQASEFIHKIVPLLRAKKHFVDIGCGGGDKLALMHFLGPKTAKLTGIEFDPITATAARKLCPFANIINDDALARTYEEYDLLYAYVPIRNPVLWVHLQNRVAETMKRGAAFVVFGATPNDDLKFKYSAGSGCGYPALYIKE